jgi:hypothetical protein
MNQRSAFDAWWRNTMTLWEIAFAAPQVIFHRMQRIALAGPRPGRRDQLEFTRMGQEKAEAFAESLMAMGLRMWQGQLAMGASVLTHDLHPWLATMADGLKPVHRRVTANARRLGGARRRR